MSFPPVSKVKSRAAKTAQWLLEQEHPRCAMPSLWSTTFMCCLCFCTGTILEVIKDSPIFETAAGHNLWYQWALLALYATCDTCTWTWTSVWSWNEIPFQVKKDTLLSSLLWDKMRKMMAPGSSPRSLWLVRPELSLSTMMIESMISTMRLRMMFEPLVRCSLRLGWDRTCMKLVFFQISSICFPVVSRFPDMGTSQVFAGHLLEGGPSITFHDFKYILLEKGGAIQAWWTCLLSWFFSWECFCVYRTVWKTYRQKNRQNKMRQRVWSLQIQVMLQDSGRRH